jgi:Holliday junction resolvase RusA-like endonuclease
MVSECGEITLVIPVTPMPAPRPRMSKWGSAYFPPAYDAYKKDLKAALPAPESQMMGELKVEAHFVCKPIAKSIFTTPAGDVDNIVKGVLDVLTQVGYYGDDRQIIDLYVTKRFPAEGEEPHQVIKLLEV